MRMHTHTHTQRHPHACSPMGLGPVDTKSLSWGVKGHPGRGQIRTPGSFSVGKTHIPVVHTHTNTSSISAILSFCSVWQAGLQCPPSTPNPTFNSWSYYTVREREREGMSSSVSWSLQHLFQLQTVELKEREKLPALQMLCDHWPTATHVQRDVRCTYTQSHTQTQWTLRWAHHWPVTHIKCSHSQFAQQTLDR